LGGDGPVIEYALKMRQFPQSQLLSTLQANGELTSAHIDEMAKQIAISTSAHRKCRRTPAGTPDSVMAPVRAELRADPPVPQRQGRPAA
jgi:aminoglycoside phosphotransferase family enzyme